MGASRILFPVFETRSTRWSMILGVTIWFLNLNTIYALPSLACQWNWFPFTIAGIPGLKIVEGGITIICMLIMAFLIYLPWQTWRKFQTQMPQKNSQALTNTQKDHRSLMAFVTMLLNSFFLLSMVMFFVPILALNACVRG